MAVECYRNINQLFKCICCALIQSWPLLWIMSARAILGSSSPVANPVQGTAFHSSIPTRNISARGEVTGSSFSPCSVPVHWSFSLTCAQIYSSEVLCHHPQPWGQPWSPAQVLADQSLFCMCHTASPANPSSGFIT